uniref:Serine/threonine-protein kinase RIO1 n=1 Tax=Syphacia muris TaxID=451379 RepID=A0A0N5AH55_9BILA
MMVEKSHQSNSEKKRRVKDRADRATVEQVLDLRTRLILFRLLQRNIFISIDGCVSTGKEANVYHAVRSDGTSVAIKIYKTSILTFKDRDRYVAGEFRFRHGYCKSNPRKMVATWAEKEMRNLSRMEHSGLPVPKPILLKGHVLVMEFLGEDGWPAPRLKDAELDSVLAEKFYLDLVKYMRIMFRTCRLVHADLSEYNLIVNKEQLYIIDVSQSVEHDHPHSLNFLRSDCLNITTFFRSKEVPVLSLYNLFKVVADASVNDEQFQSYLSKSFKYAVYRSFDNSEDDALFMNAYIAHKLDHVMHFERDEKIKKEGGEVSNPFQTMITKIERSGNPSVCQIGFSYVYLRRHLKNFSSYLIHCFFSKRKQLVKEEQREKRLKKTPKHIKKRHEKAGKHR